MTDDQEVLISFLDTDMSTANKWAGDLADFLGEEAPEVPVKRIREDPLAQDFGITLGIILGSTAVTAVAKGIAAWMERRQDAELHLKKKMSNGKVHEIELRGQPGARTEQIIREFFSDN